MRLDRSCVALIGLTALVGPIVGCGEGGPNYEHATVHGKVMYAGKPVPFGSVMFVPVEEPKEGLMQPASGTIGPDGSYSLKSQTTDGAILGDHKVVIIAFEGDKPITPAPDAAPTPSASKSNVQFKSAVPRKYSDPRSTPLTRTVKPGDNTIDLDLGNDN